MGTIFRGKMGFLWMILYNEDMDIQTQVAPSEQIVGGERKDFLADPSLWLLVIANGISIYFALVEHWNLFDLMLVYWAQSVIIGFFNFLRILSLKNFSTEGFTMNGRAVAPTKETKIKTAFFFALHYGFFHVGYLFFLFFAVSFPASGVTAKAGGSFFIIISIMTFFINHAFSYFYNRKSDEARRSNIGKVMFYPYARILPMHFTIIIGGFLGAVGKGSLVLFLFLLLKLLADVLLHIQEHTIKDNKTPSTPITVTTN